MLLAIKYEQPHIVQIVLAGGATPLSPTVDAQVRHVVAANKGDLFALRQQLARGTKVNERTNIASSGARSVDGSRGVR